MKVVYVAHPLGAGKDRESNRHSAAMWAAWIAWEYGHAIVADWIVLAGVWPETHELRARGLAIDFALIARCDELWLVGGRVSPGMEMEADEARRLGKPVIDMTHLGRLAPLCIR